MVVEVIAVMTVLAVAVVAVAVVTVAVVTAAVVRLVTAARWSIDAAPGPGVKRTRHLEDVIAQGRPVALLAAGRAQAVGR